MGPSQRSSQEGAACTWKNTLVMIARRDSPSMDLLFFQKEMSASSSHSNNKKGQNTKTAEYTISAMCSARRLSACWDGTHHS